ncbi:MAG TPA: hypothetical protein VGM95_04870 [Lactobacillaceae bacterium]|jgi:MFS family permease
MNIYWTNIKFRTLLNATALEVIGAGIFNLAFIVYASQMPNPKLAITAVTIINSLPVVMQFLSGYFADKTIHRYRNMMLVRFGQMFAYLLLSALIGFQANWLIFGLLILINLGSDLFGSYGGYLELPIQKKILKNEEFYAANSLTSAVNTTINLLAQISGASILILLNNNFVLFGLLNAATFGIAFLVLWQHRQLFTDTDKKVVTVAEKSAFWQENLTNFKRFKQFPQITSFVGAALLANFLFSSFEGLINLSLLHTMSMRWGTYAFSVAFWNVLLMLGIILGSLLPNDFFKKYSIKQLILLNFISFLPLTLLLAFYPNRYLAVPAIFSIGYLLAKINPKIGAFMMQIIPEESLAPVSGIMSTAVTMSIPLGQGIFLGLATAFGTQLSWFLIDIGACFGILLSLRLPNDTASASTSDAV